MLLQLLKLLLLLLVHEGDGHITGGCGRLQRGVDQWGPDDGAWPGGHRAAAPHDSTSSCCCCSDGLLHGRHAVVFDNLLDQHAVTGTQTACCKTSSWTASSPTSTTAHAAPQ